MSATFLLRHEANVRCIDALAQRQLQAGQMPQRSRDPTSSFWPLLLRILKARGFTQREVSRRMGISTQGIQRWKHGWPDAMTIRRLSAVLGVPGDRLLPPLDPNETPPLIPYVYPSLIEFLASERARGIKDDEREHLLGIGFIDEDPGVDTWYDALRNFRARKRGEREKRENLAPSQGTLKSVPSDSDGDD